MDLSTLQAMGLTDGEIKVYQSLLEQGPLTVARLIQATGLKKGDCYNKVYDLVKRGLVQEYDQANKKHFRLVDPRKLEELAATQFATASQAKRELEVLLPGILSAYNLAYHRPGIVLFEGEEAQRRILEDSLGAKGTILQIADSEAFDRYFPDIDAAYVEKRLRQGVKKQMLIPKSPANYRYVETRSRRYLELTEIRFIPDHMSRFLTSMLIYNDKIAYQTLQPNSMIGVIIEDRLISTMHRGLFKSLWKRSIGPGRGQDSDS